MITLFNIKDARVKVYGLVDPRTYQVKYIGVTRQRSLGVRLSQHVYDSYNDRGSRRKRAWIRHLRDLGWRPLIVELDHCKVSEEEEFERNWIKFYRDQGYNLLNEAAGGAGASLKQKAQDKLRRKEGMLLYRAREREATSRKA